MDLENDSSIRKSLSPRPRRPFRYLLLLLFSSTLALSDGIAAQRKPQLIDDTDIAEGKETAEPEGPKEPNPMLSEQNLKVGDFYFKRKNYAAAIDRYIEAIEYQPDSVKAYEALTRAYEKAGKLAKAVNVCREFLEKFPESPKSQEFRNKITELEK